MDSLTQIVLGASVGEATLGKKIGNRAILWGAIAGTIPDLDVMVKYFTDELTANEMHRGFSHSLIFCLLLSPILGWLLQKLYRKWQVSFKEWTWFFFLCLFTHPLLDMHTSWGTQLLWPLDIKFSYNNIFVADPLYTLPFLTCVLIAMTMHRTNPKRRFWNRLGLIISSSYMALTIGIKFYVLSKFKSSLEAQEISYADISTRPTPLNSILWTANVETEASYRIGYYSLLDSDTKVDFATVPKNHQLLDQVEDEMLKHRLIKLSAGEYALQQDSTGLHFCDLRFGVQGMDPENDAFVFRYRLLKEDDGGWHVRQIQPSFDGSMSETFGQLFERIKGK